MSQHKVLITGMGVVAAPGWGGGEFVGSLAAAPAAFSAWPEDQRPPAPGTLLGLAGNYPKERYFTERQLRLADRPMTMATTAVGLALDDAGYAIGTSCEKDEIATLIGSMRSEHGSSHKFSTPLWMGRPKSLAPAQFPMIARNVTCGQIAITFGVRGMSSMMGSGPLASLHAIARGYELIRTGRVKMAIVGGIESLMKFSISHSRHLYANHFSAARPAFFGVEPGLLVPAEGSAMLILEQADHARQRGATPYAELAHCMAGRLGREASGNAAERILSGWLDTHTGHATPWRDIGLISSSQSGSDLAGSLVETAMLRAVYERHDVASPLTAVRSLVGEAESTASALQVLVAAHALKTGSILPTHNVAQQTGVGLTVARQSMPLRGSEALVTAFDQSLGYAFMKLARTD